MIYYKVKRAERERNREKKEKRERERCMSMRYDECFETLKSYSKPLKSPWRAVFL